MQFDEGWIKFFSQEIGKEYFSKMAANIQVQRNEGKPVLPREGEVFQAFKLCPFESVKVVIVGQEPYPLESSATGLAFSTPPAAKIPQTLRNIFEELSRTLNVPEPSSGDLSSWASNGMLLLNSTLTVIEGAPASHRGIGWDEFTANCIKYISQQKDEQVVFCLWGRQAQAVAPFIDQKKHLVLKSSHPSPLSVNQGFKGCGHFIHINRQTGVWK